MYRRVSSDRFMVLTTLGIVVVMAIFTWVMYGMAQQVFTMTDVMIDLNESFQAMSADIHIMGGNIEGMAGTIDTMGANINGMSGDMSTMNENISGMTGDIKTMASSVPAMTDAVLSMAGSVDRMTQDISRATYAFTQPMSYMWGNVFPF